MNNSPNGQNGEWFYDAPSDTAFQNQNTTYESNAYGAPNRCDAKGSSSQVFGILSLVALCFCQLLSIVFGAIAIAQSKTSRKALSYECSEAKTGRICGLIGLIIGAISVLFTVAMIIFVTAMIIIGSMAV